MKLMDKDAARKTIELISAAIDKQYKTTRSILLMGDEGVVDIPRIPFGVPVIDQMIGGGVPMGRNTEIFGSNGCGKSTLAYSLIGQAQKKGLTVAYLDLEHAVSPLYAESLGADMSEIFIAQPESGEQALDIADRLITSGAVDLIIIDSLGLVSPSEELAKSMDEFTMASQPRLIGKFVRKTTASANLNNVALVCINQVRAKMGNGQQGTTTPGGHQLHHSFSLRMELARTGWIRKSTDTPVVGQTVKVRVPKSKVSRTMLECTFEIRFDGKGVNAIGSMVDMALKAGVITKTGEKSNWLVYGDHKWNGKDKAAEFLASDLDLYDEIQDLVLHGSPAADPVDDGDIDGD